MFQAKWGVGTQPRTDFALVLFVGLLLHGFLAESIVRAPQLIVSQPNLVRKVVFPLEVLPIVAVGSALFHFVVGFAIWLLFHFLASGAPPITTWLLPVVVLPLAIMTLGLCWFLASLGVYLRDVAYVMPFLATVLLFASPIFYPLETLREPFRSVRAVFTADLAGRIGTPDAHRWTTSFMACACRVYADRGGRRLHGPAVVPGHPRGFADVL